MQTVPKSCHTDTKEMVKLKINKRAHAKLCVKQPT